MRTTRDVINELLRTWSLKEYDILSLVVIVPKGDGQTGERVQIVAEDGVLAHELVQKLDTLVEAGGRAIGFFGSIGQQCPIHNTAWPTEEYADSMDASAILASMVAKADVMAVEHGLLPPIQEN